MNIKKSVSVLILATSFLLVQYPSLGATKTKNVITKKIRSAPSLFKSPRNIQINAMLPLEMNLAGKVNAPGFRFIIFQGVPRANDLNFLDQFNLKIMDFLKGASIVVTNGLGIKDLLNTPGGIQVAREMVGQLQGYEVARDQMQNLDLLNGALVEVNNPLTEFQNLMENVRVIVIGPSDLFGGEDLLSALNTRTSLGGIVGGLQNFVGGGSISAREAGLQNRQSWYMSTFGGKIFTGGGNNVDRTLAERGWEFARGVSHAGSHIVEYYIHPTGGSANVIVLRDEDGENPRFATPADRDLALLAPKNDPPAKEPDPPAKKPEDKKEEPPPEDPPPPPPPEEQPPAEPDVPEKSCPPEVETCNSGSGLQVPMIHRGYINSIARPPRGYAARPSPEGENGVVLSGTGAILGGVFAIGATDCSPLNDNCGGAQRNIMNPVVVFVPVFDPSPVNPGPGDRP